MAKSRRKKNYKLRRRVMRTVAALTMIMAIVVAAIPVENYGTTRAADGRVLGDITNDLDAAEAVYESDDYEDNYNGAKATVQRIIENDGGGSFVEVFKVQKGSSGNDNTAMIIEDIIGDGYHGETQLTINATEYCDYVQFDAAFIKDVENALKDTANNNADKEFKLEFTDTPQSIAVPDAGTSQNLSAIMLKKINKENPADTPVGVSVNISTNDNAQGYTGFTGNLSLNSKTMYDQDFGKAIYDQRINAIDQYNQSVDALKADIDRLVARVSAAGYTWQGSDTTEWNGYIQRAADLDRQYSSMVILSTPWTGFQDADNGLNGVIDYIIRNDCKNGNKDLKSFRLKGLTKRLSNGDTESVYVPQYIGEGTYTGQLDDKNYLASSSVQIRGIASYSPTGNKVFYETHLNTVVLPRVEFIGKDAFGHSDVESVTIDTTTCRIVGEGAFGECTKLKTVNFSSIGASGSQTFMTIDKKAFYNTAITAVEIPYSVTVVGAGAFAGTRELLTVTFEDSGRGNDIEIEKYAFYDCTKLTSVSFPENNSKQYKIGKGAFALANPGGAIRNFLFPGGNTDIAYSNDSDDYDYILANRTTLETVKFPGLLKSEVPDNTLSGCNNLLWVEFPENARNASYDPEQLFSDVWGNPDFYVIGPETLDQPGSIAKPRETTWKAKAGKTSTGSWTLSSVPYRFTDKDGKVHFEIGVSDDNGNLEYIANIEEIDKENKLASLISYRLYDKDADPEKVWIKIPTTVGEYKIVSIEEGCFDDAETLKNNITKLTIGDSVTDIKAGAFKEMPKLQWVDIGSGVKNIESEAFAGCEDLENVVFSQAITGTLSEDNVEYWQELKIADDAFKTNSNLLTFHGAVNPNYAPFKLAMSSNNSDMLSGDAQICYKTDAPLNLTIIRNRNGGKATLVDYPHYEDIKALNPDAVQMFEDIFINGTESDQSKLDTDAGKVILQTLKMELPSGIESIDAKSFFAAGSRNNLDYPYIGLNYEQRCKVNGEDSQVQSDYEPIGASDDGDLRKTYSEDAYKEDLRYAEVIGDTAYENNAPNQSKTNFIVSTGGLFSGGFKDARESIGTDSAIWMDPYENHTYIENYDSGNDYLTSIDMRGVTELPKYAFDSCENLLTVHFNAMESMGDLPFRGCKNLYNINTGNSKFAFQNMLLYETKQDGSYEIVECLEGRGTGQADNGHYYYTGSVTSKGEEGANVDSMLANVTSIREGAFSNCTEITTVDLEDSRITSVPQRAFENCENLFQVTLPETIMGIDQKAFKGAADRNLYVTIKNPNCTIAVDAFDFDTTKEVFITGIPTDDKGNESICHYNYEQIKKELERDGKDANRIHFAELGSTCLLTFVDDNMDVIETIEIEKGGTLRNPPTAPVKTGWKFEQWICTNVRGEDGKALIGEATYSDVTEDRTIMANYVRDDSSVIPDGKDYNLTVVNGYAMIEGNIVTTFPTVIKGGTSVTIVANDTTNNFRVWTIVPSTSISLLSNPSSPATSFTMPNADVTVTANMTISGGDAQNPDGTYSVTVTNGTGGGNYRPGTTVTLTANAAPTGQTFVNWTLAGVSVANTNTATITFTMPSSPVVAVANYSGGTTTNPTGTYTLTVQNGTGGGQFAQGATVTITANRPNEGASFVNWTTTTTGVTFASATASTTTFTMPASNVTVTANFSDGTGGQPGGSTTGTYRVTVNYGSGSGNYAAGATVNITANAPESSSRVFSRWTTANSGLGFANANAVSTSFVMPAADVTVTANYKTRTSSDDDDDDRTPSRRPGTNTNTTTVDNRPSNSTSTTTSTTGTVSNPTSGSSTTTNNNNGNRIYITKNGISNTDVASLAVSGSTDNFIVRITESPDATAAVEQALTNTYGSLNGLAYLPMDISLYDSTGQNKITDTTGLNITVTMPIPDVLIQYGGNARVAAADNGTLQQITPRFTTIDGIACVSFIPPHFSPYVIYVDTNNLIAGQMYDTTPATGDPIHPKWFAAIGMACVSILLFVMSDGRKRKKYRAA